MRFILFTLCNAHTHTHTFPLVRDIDYRWNSSATNTMQCIAIPLNCYFYLIWCVAIVPLNSSIKFNGHFFLYIYWYIIEIQMDHIFLASILYFILIGYVFNFFFRDNSLLRCMIFAKKFFFNQGLIIWKFQKYFKTWVI